MMSDAENSFRTVSRRTVSLTERNKKTAAYMRREFRKAIENEFQ